MKMSVFLSQGLMAAIQKERGCARMESVEQTLKNVLSSLRELFGNHALFGSEGKCEPNNERVHPNSPARLWTSSYTAARMFCNAMARANHLEIVIHYFGKPDGWEPWVEACILFYGDRNRSPRARLSLNASPSGVTGNFIHTASYRGDIKRVEYLKGCVEDSTGLAAFINPEFSSQGFRSMMGFDQRE